MGVIKAIVPAIRTVIRMASGLRSMVLQTARAMGVSIMIVAALDMILVSGTAMAKIARITIKGLCKFPAWSFKNAANISEAPEEAMASEIGTIKEYMMMAPMGMALMASFAEISLVTTTTNVARSAIIPTPT